MSRGPNLTWVMIGVVVFVGVMSLIYSSDWGIYNNFMTDNGQSISSEYRTLYGNLTGQKDDLGGFASDFSDFSIKSTVVGAGSAILSTLNIGMNAIRLLGNAPNYVLSIFTVAGKALHIPEPLSWMITTIIIIFLAAKLIKALRGQSDEP